MTKLNSYPPLPIFRIAKAQTILLCTQTQCSFISHTHAAIFIIKVNSILLNLLSCLPFGLRTGFSSFLKLGGPSPVCDFPDNGHNEQNQTYLATNEDHHKKICQKLLKSKLECLPREKGLVQD